jgi:hypothetical protein
MRTRWGTAALGLLTFTLLAASQNAVSLTLARGARVGVISLLDPEVTHYHEARAIKDSFLKTHTVAWPIDSMLGDAVKDRLTQLGLVPVPLGVTEALDRGREDCFLNAALHKGLPKECSPPFAQLAGAQHVDAIIVLGPGLNNSTHAGGTRRKDLPDYLRGWGFVTGEEGAAKPTLFNMTEMLLVGLTPQGATLSGREWGGAYALDWDSFMPPADLKAIPPQELNDLQPLFESILTRQASRLLEHLDVN